jgi:hypothetical protein
LDPQAQALLAERANKTVRLIACNPHLTSKNREQVKRELRELHGLVHDESIFFIEVQRGDTSEFTETIAIQGFREDPNRVLRARSPAVANAIAALLIQLKQMTGCIPHVYFHWADVDPVVNLTRFIFLGEGDTAPLTHEILRRAIKDPAQRPIVHVS